MEPSSITKENCWGQACVRGVPEWRQTEADSVRLWSHKMLKISELCDTYQRELLIRNWTNSRSLSQPTKIKGVRDLESILTSDMKSLEFAWLVFCLALIPIFWNGNVSPMSLYAESLWSDFLFWFYGVLDVKDRMNLRRDLNFEL